MGPEVDLEDILNMFGGMGMGGMPGMPGMHSHGMHGFGMPNAGPGGRKPRGPDSIQSYSITLEEVYKGKTVKLASTRKALCTQCKG